MSEYDSKEEAVGALLEQVDRIIEELYQSGFDTIHDSTLEELEKVCRLTKQYGMEYLFDLLGELFKGVSMRRHRIGKRAEDGMGGVYTKISEYLYLGMEQVEYDRGYQYYCEDKIYMIKKTL